MGEYGSDYVLGWAAGYAGLGFFLTLGVAFVGAGFLLSSWLGPRLRFPAKSEPFECGGHPLTTPYQRVPVKFFMVAVSFVVFDVGIALLYPWAVVFGDLGWYGFAVAALFVAVLSVGLAYEWRKGALDWR